MTLRPLAEVGAAAWLAGADVPWYDLVAYGPPGFAAYARLVLAGGAEPEAEGGDLDDPALRLALGEVLAEHTSIPDDAYFCLWDGIGLEGGHGWALPAEGEMPERYADADLVPTPTAYPAAFPAAVMQGPRVVVGAQRERTYLLFGGALADNGRWGDDPGHGGVGGPHLFWPADHAWCVASDVDGDPVHDLRWTGVGGSRALIDALHADDRFDVVPAHPYA